MKLFRIGQHQYININGKDFSLLRAHKDYREQLCFLMVTGTYQLAQADIPKSWSVTKHDGYERPIYIASRDSAFKIEKKKSVDHKLILAGSFNGGRHLAALVLLQYMNEAPSAPAIRQVLRFDDNQPKYNRLFKRVDDLGEMGVPAIELQTAAYTIKRLRRELRG